MDPLPTRQITSQTLHILGSVGAPIFAAWIARHARRLDLGCSIALHRADRLEVVVTGLPDLLDAMALACSLGPREVWVDQVARSPANVPAPQKFASTDG